MWLLRHLPSNMLLPQEADRSLPWPHPLRAPCLDGRCHLALRAAALPRAAGAGGSGLAGLRALFQGREPRIKLCALGADAEALQDLRLHAHVLPAEVGLAVRMLHACMLHPHTHMHTNTCLSWRLGQLPGRAGR